MISRGQTVLLFLTSILRGHPPVEPCWFCVITICVILPLLQKSLGWHYIPLPVLFVGFYILSVLVWPRLIPRACVSVSFLLASAMVFDPFDFCALGLIPWIWFLSRCGFACGFWERLLV